MCIALRKYETTICKYSSTFWEESSFCAVIWKLRVFSTIYKGSNIATIEITEAYTLIQNFNFIFNPFKKCLA
ncbi:Uncharacterised protein [Klebsiella pneumoniae]|nr:Uncharacterised protein [Klebsiella pneumoniae]